MGGEHSLPTQLSEAGIVAHRHNACLVSLRHRASLTQVCVPSPYGQVLQNCGTNCYVVYPTASIIGRSFKKQSAWVTTEKVGYVTILILGCALSSLAVLILGGIMFRRWARNKADLLIWSQHQAKLKETPPEESTETWRNNQRMDMR